MKKTNPHPVYIWQRPDWPAFRWQSDALLEPLARLSARHGQLAGQMAMLGFADKGQTNLDALCADLIGSSAIEGLALNPESVRSSLARRLGLEPGEMLATDHYVEGLVDVMMDALASPDNTLTADRLFGWHAALFPTGRSGIYRITVGDWRQGEEPMRVVSGAFGHERVHYEAPPSTTVAGEMERLIAWCNEAELSPLLKAAVAHLWFVTIHPFDDGNGRLSRTLADMQLAQLDTNGRRYYSMSAEINREKKSYYEVLERTQQGSLDITEWILWFFACLEKAIARALENIRNTLSRTTFWERWRHVDLNERQRKILGRLLDTFDGKLTTSKWAKICHCSQDTALRDINDLLAKGILCDSGEGGRSKNYVLTHDSHKI